MKKAISIFLFFFVTYEQAAASASAANLFLEEAMLELRSKKLLTFTISEKMTQIAGIISKASKPRETSMFDHGFIWSHVTDRVSRILRQGDGLSGLRQKQIDVFSKLSKITDDCDRFPDGGPESTSDLYFIFLTHLGTTHREEFM